MGVEITWYGHSAFSISGGGVSLLTDPFLTGNPKAPWDLDVLPRPDAVLVTHDHGDHTGDAVAVCRASGALCACVVGTGAKLAEQGLPPEQLPAGIGFNIGGTIEIKGARITMTQAFHTSDSGVAVGYVVTLPGGFTFYHAGDTGLFGDMALIGSLYAPDLALLPCGGFFTMDGRQAAEACRLLGVRTVIPMHWGTFPVLAQDTTEFTTHLARVVPECRAVTLQPGETVTF